jgi:hypothetical protein
MGYELNVSRSVLFKCTPTSTKSVQTPKVNSSSLSGKSTVVATVFQQITTELNGASQKKTEQWPLQKLLLELVKENGCSTATRPLV